MLEFDPGKQVDGAEVGKAVAYIISQLGDKGQLQKQSSSGVTKLVPTGPGLASLSKKLVDRIVSGQYIDFSELPPAKGQTRSLPNAEEGHIVIIRAEHLAGSKKMIPDLATWLQCFCIYTPIIIEHELAHTKSLLAYATIIAKQVSSMPGRRGWSTTRISARKWQTVQTRTGQKWTQAYNICLPCW